MGRIAVADDGLGWRDEDLALPERQRGEDEQDDPGYAHEDCHNEVPGVESRDVKDITELAEGEDPSD